MRLIGKLESGRLAQRFSEYILSRGIASRVDQEGDDWLIWIIDEDRVPSAREELDAFRQNPEVSRYDEGVRLGRKILGEQKKKQRQYERRQIDVRQRWQPASLTQSPVTMGLLFFCGMVAMLTSDSLWDIGSKKNEVMSRLMIVDVEFVGNDRIRFHKDWTKPLTDLEVWRYVTPMFIHFGFLHILFNTLWMKDLGPAVESKIGSVRFLLLVLFVSATSNIAQYVLTENPSFGGMSGVVFGLFGFIWMRGKLDPGSGFFMPGQLLVFLFVFQLLCFMGVVGNIANYAHAVGFLAGMAVGAATPLARRMLGR